MFAGHRLDAIGGLVVAGVVVAVVLLSGGGDGKQAAKAPASGAAVAAPELNRDIPAGAVATVGEASIPKSDFEHWATAASTAQRSLSESKVRDQAMEFLISSEWLRQEAQRRGITATPEEVRAEFNRQRRQSFPKDSDYRKFLSTSGQTEDDFLYRVKLSVLTNKLQEMAGQDNMALDAFVAGYEKRYRAATWCATGYVIDRCANGPPLKASATQ